MSNLLGLCLGLLFGGDESRFAMYHDGLFAFSLKVVRHWVLIIDSTADLRWWAARQWDDITRLSPTGWIRGSLFRYKIWHACIDGSMSVFLSSFWISPRIEIPINSILKTSSITERFRRSTRLELFRSPPYCSGIYDVFSLCTLILYSLATASRHHRCQFEMTPQ